MCHVRWAFCANAGGTFVLLGVQLRKLGGAVLFGEGFGVQPLGCTVQCRLKPELHACFNQTFAGILGILGALGLKA